MRKLLRKLTGRDLLGTLHSQLQDMKKGQQLMQRSLMPMLARHAATAASFNEAEFSATSQWGDDGLIQYLIHHAPLTAPSFIEFGVENYTESNTRFLLQNNCWRGLVMDGSQQNIDYILNDAISWQYELTAKHAFITVENINQLLTDAGFTGEIGLLHIDIDGNDYWVWNAINVIDPQLVIVEYSHVFGSDRPITVPYKPDFYRMDAHYSAQYAGASLSAFHHLAVQRGYKLVGVNKAGNNAYFLKEKLGANLAGRSPQEVFVESHFSDTRDEQGRLTRLRGQQKRDMIKGMPVVNVVTGETEVY